MVIVVKNSDRPAMERPLDFDTHGTPVNVDLLVYTEEEWRQTIARADRFGEERRRVVWLN